MSQNLKWEVKTVSIIKKAQQRDIFPQELRKHKLPQTLLSQSLSLHPPCLSGLDHALRGKRQNFSASSAQQKISLDAASSTWKRKWTKEITTDPTCPANSFFRLPPSGVRYWTVKTKTTSIEMVSFQGLRCSTMTDHIDLHPSNILLNHPKQ